MVQCPRGTRDFLPDELEKRRAYEGTLRNVARRFGFREIQTPIFEEAELFILRSGPNVLKELYAFKDKGDRDLALRPEMTAAVVRAFVNGMSNDPKPIKVFYFGPCFTYERRSTSDSASGTRGPRPEGTGSSTSSVPRSWAPPPPRPMPRPSPWHPS